MAGLFQGDPLPDVTSTTETQQTAPEFYTNYLQDIANLGQNAVQQGGVAGFSPLQQQAFQMAPDMAFAGQGSMGAASQLLGEAGATTVPDVIADYMNPYTRSVVGEMGRLQQQNIQRNVLPTLNAAGASTGQFGSQRQLQATGNTLADMQSNLLGQQMGALQQGYSQAGTMAGADLNRALQAGQGFSQLGTSQQNLGLSGIKTLSDYGAQQQAMGQKMLDQPMTQAQQFAKLMQGYQQPTGTVEQKVGPVSGAYSNSPLSQISSLLAGLGSFMPKAHGGVINKATGGSVSPPSSASYHDGNGNFYDKDGILVES
jgi:hypothetical protein